MWPNDMLLVNNGYFSFKHCNVIISWRVISGDCAALNSCLTKEIKENTEDSVWRNFLAASFVISVPNLVKAT
jgi:hypothetical protein